MPVLIPAAPFPIQIPTCGPGKQSRTAQGFGTLHPRGIPGRGSWLWIGIVSAVVAAWGVNHRAEELPLCLSSLHICLSNKKNKINLKKKKKENLSSQCDVDNAHFTDKKLEGQRRLLK